MTAFLRMTACAAAIRRIASGVPLLLTALGCAPHEEREPRVSPVAIEMAQSAGLVPVWNRGDRWVVRFNHRLNREYLRRPDKVIEIDWEYVVDEVDDDTVHVVARELREGEPQSVGARELLIERSGRLVYAGVIDLSRQRPEELPYLEHSFATTFAYSAAWPSFPLFDVGQDDAATTQRVAGTPDGREVTTSFLNEEYEKIVTRRVVTQVWEPGRPWWTSMTIRDTTVRDGVPDETFTLIKGHIAEWPDGQVVISEPPRPSLEL
mgnify:CR=1 FL=1